MTTQNDDKRGVAMSLRRDRPIVIKCPDGQTIELTWGRRDQNPNSHRDVFLVLPNGYVAFKP